MEMSSDIAITGIKARRVRSFAASVFNRSWRWNTQKIAKDKGAKRKGERESPRITSFDKYTSSSSSLEIPPRKIKTLRIDARRGKGKGSKLAKGDSGRERRGNQRGIISAWGVWNFLNIHVLSLLVKSNWLWPPFCSWLFQTTIQSEYRTDTLAKTIYRAPGGSEKTPQVRNIFHRFSEMYSCRIVQV